MQNRKNIPGLIQASQHLFTDLQTRLEQIGCNDLCLQQIEESFDVCNNAVQSLREMIKEKKFARRKEELFFFKTIKPQFVSLERYYVLLYNHCMFKPDDHTERVKYLERSLLKLDRFFKEQNWFYAYYQSGSHSLDHEYFLRANDEDFNTPGEMLISDIIAHQMFAKQIRRELGSG